MTVGDLIRVLQVLDEDTEVRIASQPSWPFEYAIDGVTTKRRVQERENEAGYREDVPYAEGEEVSEEQDIAFIVEGEQLCYGSRVPFDRATHIMV